ncbi:MAG: AsmA-like C-terminal domain-containing protein [Alphaproteobacteria bacterium]|nr:AsmA-like C-terminal domain-containing protein [Alphaproteobacteria bacterium]
MKKVSSRLYFARKVFDYTILVILLVFLLFVWQLYKGPISVPFLKPYILAALNPDGENVDVSVESVNIELVRSVKPIKIIANKVVYKRDDESLRIAAPRTSVSFSIKALLRGIIAPTAIVMEKPAVYIFTNYGVKKEDKAEEITEKKLDYYLTQYENVIERFYSNDMTYPESYLSSIKVIGGEVEFHEIDFGRKWILSDLNFNFERGSSDMSTEVSALLDFGDNTVVSAGIDMGYKFADNKLVLQAYFDDLVPSSIIDKYAEANNFYKIMLPVSGKVTTVVDFNEFENSRENLVKAVEKAIGDIAFQFEGGKGSIIFSADDQESKYDISSFVLDGKISGGLDKLEIKNADFNLGEQKVKLGFGAVGVEKLLLQSSWEDLKLKLSADIGSLKLNDLYIYWPRYIAPDAWEWCKENIFGGNIKDAHFEFDFGYDKKKKTFGFENLGGKAYIEDSNLKYIDTMPMVTNVYGDFRVTSNSIEIALDKAKSEGIMLDSGNVRIYDLDKYNNYISIKLLSNSSIEDALRLIDHQPLEFAKKLGLKTSMFKGTADTELSLDFELKNDLDYDEVKVKVKSKLFDVETSELAKGKVIQAKELDLQVDNQGLLVDGDVIFDGIPLNVSWDDRFDNNDDKDNSIYKIKLKADEALFKKLGVSSKLLSKPYVDGFALVEAVIKPTLNGYDVNVSADMLNTALDFSFLGLLKQKDEKGKLGAKVVIENDKISSIPSFDFEKQDFQIAGKATFDKENRAKVIDISKIKGDKTNASAKVEFNYKQDQKISISISGNSYNLSEFFERKDTAQNDSDDNNDWENTPNVDVNIAVNTLWSNPDVAVTNFVGTAKLVNGIGVYEAHLFGNYDYNKEMMLRVDYVPKPNKEFYLTVKSNSAGNTLRFLRIYNDLYGGNLQIEAKRRKDKLLIGHAKIRDFSIHNTPVLAKLLTVASFTGMLDLLTGDGMTFSHFDAPFKYKDKILYVGKANAYGNVLGLSFSGEYNMGSKAINVEGTFAPAYGLNTLIGKIPVVGNLLAGKDGTVFAANYTIEGTSDEPEVIINPLSALSPNSLKEVVSSIFGEDGKENEF